MDPRGTPAVTVAQSEEPPGNTTLFLQSLKQLWNQLNREPVIPTDLSFSNNLQCKLDQVPYLCHNKMSSLLIHYLAPYRSFYIYLQVV